MVSELTAVVLCKTEGVKDINDVFEPIGVTDSFGDSDLMGELVKTGLSENTEVPVINESVGTGEYDTAGLVESVNESVAIGLSDSIADPVAIKEYVEIGDTDAIGDSVAAEGLAEGLID